MIPTPIFTRIINNIYLDSLEIHCSEGLWYITDGKEYLSIPEPQDAVRFVDYSISSRLEHIRNKYEYKNFVEVEHGDSVIDIGSFIGEFSLSVHSTCNNIISFEPDSNNIVCLEQNTSNIPNITSQKVLLWHSNESKMFFESEDGTESGIFDPDLGGVKHISSQTAQRLDNIIKEPVDFAKVEAEGAELEVIAGFGDLQIEKIAVDCSEPRGTNLGTPDPLIRELLEARGYDVRSKQHSRYGPMLFARRY